MTIDGKVVAITGASSGIGEATASLLAERGAKLVLGACNPDTLNALAERLSTAGGAAVARPTDVSSRGDLMAALPVFRRQRSGHFVNLASTAAFRITPGQSVYAGTKMAVRAISEGLRQEASDNLRVTIISPGMTSTNFAESVTDPAVRADLQQRHDAIAMPPVAVARAIAFAIDQPAGVDIGEVVVRPTAQA